VDNLTTTKKNQCCFLMNISFLLELYHLRSPLFMSSLYNVFYLKRDPIPALCTINSTLAWLIYRTETPPQTWGTAAPTMIRDSHNEAWQFVGKIIFQKIQKADLLFLEPQKWYHGVEFTSIIYGLFLQSIILYFTMLKRNIYKNKQILFIGFALSQY